MNVQLELSLLIIVIVNIETTWCIRGGKKANRDEFPYQIFLWDRNLCASCGGAIIDALHILTAGHCIHGATAETYLVYAGITNVVHQTPIVREVEGMRVDKGYKPHVGDTFDEFGEPLVSQADNDIAILKLKTPLIWEQHVDLIPLPTEDVTSKSQSVHCKVAGWGRTEMGKSPVNDDLWWMETMILTTPHCKLLSPEIGEREICTLDPYEEATALMGDSGSGLVCNGYLVGILSSVADDPSEPVIYTNVYRYLSFINKFREKNQKIEEPERKTEEIEDPCTEKLERRRKKGENSPMEEPEIKKKKIRQNFERKEHPTKECEIIK